jgi:hypothetical protein
MCSAVHLPDGAGAVGAPSAAADDAAGRAAGKGAPADVLGVQVGARAEQLLDDRVTVVVRRLYQGGVPIPAHGGALRRG